MSSCAVPSIEKLIPEAIEEGQKPRIPLVDDGIPVSQEICG
jgi:hypothetical protein